MELIKKNKFNINLVNQNCENKKIEIDETTFSSVEKIVKKKLTEVKGTTAEIEKHNQMISRCVLGDKNAQSQVKFLIRKEVRNSGLVSDEDIDFVVNRIFADNYGLGAIDGLIDDKSINEIWVNGFDRVFIEKNGIKSGLNLRFRSDDEVIRIMRQMLQYNKKDITASDPTKESRLLDGSRVTFAIPPVASRPYINIRKFDAFDLTEENIIKSGTIDKKILDFLKILIKGRANILIIGETGGGKTSFLKFLVKYINPNLRIGTIESNFELKLAEAYPERSIFEYEEHEELGRTLGELFKLCLRSHPDIMLLGEMRGSDEAEQYINCCRRGHPGSMGTLHTNSPEMTVPDLVEMILEDGKKKDPIMLTNRIANSVEIIIQLHNFEKTGEKKAVKISEVVPEGYGEYEINNIFSYNQLTKEFDRHNKIKNAKLVEKMYFFDVTEEEIKSL